MITRPMLAPNDDFSIQCQYFPFPGIYSPKKDGFRCFVAKNMATTRGGKPFPNLHTRKLISALPNGLDGEVTSGDTFRSAQSVLSREHGEPDITYHIFDYVKDNLNKPFCERLVDLQALAPSLPPWCAILPQYVINNQKDLESFEKWCIYMGNEGFMGRIPNGPYKCNRSTLKQAFLLKGKRFTDSEAEILYFVEAQKNNNEATTSELGFTKRSSHQDGKEGKGILGAIGVRDIHNGKEFEIGTGVGWDLAFREEVFNNQDKYRGKIIVYKFLDHGNYDLPRNASMKGFRDKWDMS